MLGPCSLHLSLASVANRHSDTQRRPRVRGHLHVFVRNVQNQLSAHKCRPCSILHTITSWTQCYTDNMVAFDRDAIIGDQVCAGAWLRDFNVKPIKFAPVNVYKYFFSCIKLCSETFSYAYSLRNIVYLQRGQRNMTSSIFSFTLAMSVARACLYQESTRCQ